MPNVKHLLLLGNLADSFPPLVAIIDRCELVGTKEGYEFQFHAVKMTVSIAVYQCPVGKSVILTLVLTLPCRSTYS